MLGDVEKHSSHWVPVTPHPFLMGLTRIVYTTHIIDCTLEGKMASICPPKLAELKKNPSCFVMFCLKSKGGLTCFAKSETIKTKKKSNVCVGKWGAKWRFLFIHGRNILEMTLAEVGHSVVFNKTYCQPSLSSLWEKKMPAFFLQTQGNGSDSSLWSHGK